MATTTIRQGDRNAQLREALTLDDGTAPDLTGASVRVHVRRLLRRALIVDAPAAVEEPASGVVAYRFRTADIAAPGTLQVEWEVSFANGEVRSFPLHGWSLIDVLPRIGPMPELEHGAAHRVRMGIGWAAGLAMTFTGHANVELLTGAASAAGHPGAHGISAGASPIAGASAPSGAVPSVQAGASIATHAGGVQITTRTPRYSTGVGADSGTGEATTYAFTAAVRRGAGAHTLAGHSGGAGAAPAASGHITYHSEVIEPATGYAETEGYVPIAQLPGQGIAQTRTGEALGSGIVPGFYYEAPHAVALGDGSAVAGGHAPAVGVGALGASQDGEAQSVGHPPVIGNGRQLIAQAQNGSAATVGYSPTLNGIVAVELAEGSASATGLEPTISAVVNTTAPNLTATGDGTVGWADQLPASSAPVVSAVGDGTVLMEAA